MSTILDALKKSEQERKLNNIPTLSDMPAPEEPSGVLKAWIVGGLVFCGLLLLSMALLLGDRYFASDISNVDKSPTDSLSNGASLAGQVTVDDQIIINVVSWSEDAGQRFVIINGKMVRENEFAAPGLKVLEIKRESVLVNFRGEYIERRP